jgi:uncharacterized membrane protein YvbJ
MSTICPNCSHPLRTGAKFCGYCGANLTSPAEVKPVSTPIAQGKTNPVPNSTPKKQPKPKRIKTGQVVAIIAIIILFLLVILAMICSHWSEISQMLLQIFY